MCLSFLSLMGSSKTKAKLLNCALEVRGSWSHVQDSSDQWVLLWPMERAQSEQRFDLLIYFFVLAVTAPQGTCWFALRAQIGCTA